MSDIFGFTQIAELIHAAQDSGKLNLSHLMDRILPNSGTEWEKYWDLWIPSKINTTCPHCLKFTTLETASQKSINNSTVAMIGRCNLCNEISKIWVTGCKQRSEEAGFDEVWLLPKPLKSLETLKDELLSTQAKKLILDNNCSVSPLLIPGIF